MEPAATYVVRGGSSMSVETITAKLLDAVDDGDGAVLSVFCGDQQVGEAPQEALRRICELAGIPHPKIMAARLDAIVATGVELEADTTDGQPDNHHHARFGEPVEESQVLGFISCFDGPMPNPTGGRRAGRL